MDFKFDDADPDQLLHEVKLINTQTKEVFNDLLTFVYIEIVKFDKQAYELITREDQWLYVLHNLTQLKEIPLSLVYDPVFKQFFMDAEEASLAEAELWAYYASRKAEWDSYAQKETARIEGKTEGKAEAVEEFIKSLFKNTNFTPEEIANLVNVNLDFVLTVKASLI